MLHKKLGRVRPVSITEDIRFRTLRYPSGKYTIVAKLGYHYDYGKDQSPPPTSVDYGSSSAAQSVLSQMYLNDSLGDCVIASADHLLGVDQAAESNTTAIATNTEVQNDYVAACGPGDQGCVITDVLNYMQTTGMTIGGKNFKTSGYASVDNTNKLLSQVAIDLFGGLKLGINLPNSWYSNDSPGFTWDVPPSNDTIVGGHDIFVFGYNSIGVLVSTWGMTGTLTWTAFADTTYVQEAYAVLANDWTSNSNLAPNGINVATLSADLALINQGKVPVINPPPVPPSPPVPPVPPSTVTITSSQYSTALAVVTATQGSKVNRKQNVFEAAQAMASVWGPLVNEKATELIITKVMSDSRVVEAVKKYQGVTTNPLPIVEIVTAILPVLISDITAGNKPIQIVEDVVSALLKVLG